MGRTRTNFHSVEIENLSNTIVENLTKYSAEVADDVVRIVKEVSKETAEMLDRTSPEDKGKYRSKWRLKVGILNSGHGINVTLHNTEYQLTHLLEYGHDIVGRNGRIIGKTKAQPHISNAREWASEQVEKRIEEAIESK